MILATDLDGTFLGGDDESREQLYRILRAADDATLIFVTGRGLDSVLPLLEDPDIPNPDYIIADVGATVVDGESLLPIGAVQDPIEARWPGKERVRRALERFDGLREQDNPMERRLSFFTERGRVPEGLAQVVEDELGCDLLVSAEIYLDVLPRGVSKGSTLLALIEHLGLEHDRVVVAGDTLNDLSLFEVDLKGIVVGGAEGALSERVSRIGGGGYLASAPGCGGIVEGLIHHGFVPRESAGLAETGAEAAAEVSAPSGPAGTAAPAAGSQPREEAAEPTQPGEGPAADRQLIMVYHRLPFDEVRRGGRTHRRPPQSPNGIIPTLLGFFAGGRKGLWVAWSKQESRSLEGVETEVSVDPERYPNLTAVRVPLTRDDVNLFYEVFSKEALWPVLFAFPERVKFEAEHWEHYLEINRIFAERTAAVAEHGALVWVHEYNLWMVPYFLRQLRPDLTIAFFHHTAFPPSDIFNIIPWRDEIVNSLLQCDYVGFHIPRYVENFVDVVRTHAPMEVISRVPCTPRFLSFGCALGIDEVTRELRVGDRTVRLGAHPVGINVHAINEILEEEQNRERIAGIREELAGRTSILSIERLDYVKGPLEKLEAFERLLENHPELHGKVVLVTVCTPPAPGMTIYRTTRQKVDQAVGRINGRFSRIDWTPVRYFYRSLPYPEVIAHYAVSDIAWITPLRDGLNMVAKEYVAANHAMGGTGALVLSEFAGAAAELHGALLTNPYDPQQMANDLYEALTMPVEERRERMAMMFDIVDANDIDYWSYEFLAAVDGYL